MTAPENVLYIGNRNYSSWSLRAALACAFAGLAHRTERILLDTPDFPAQVRAISGAARVPVLVTPEFTVWDSLAICEYAADVTGSGWPAERRLRAHARSAVAEMHSGFPAIRGLLPMNIRARRRIEPSPAEQARLEAEIERMTGLWCEALALHDGGAGFLYGTRGIADAFFAPVVFRFLTYGIPVPELCRPWFDALLADASVADWVDGALAETEVVDADEAGVPC